MTPYVIVSEVNVHAGTASLDVAVMLVLTAILGSWRQNTLAPVNVSYRQYLQNSLSVYMFSRLICSNSKNMTFWVPT